jgi:tellurite resistance protein
MSEDALMNREQAEVFARGLYHLANVDGIDERELELIRDFLVESGHPDLVDQLGAGDFDAGSPARVIKTTFLRRVYLRTAIALVKADGIISESENTALRDAAERLGLAADLEELLAEPVGHIEK